MSKRKHQKKKRLLRITDRKYEKQRERAGSFVIGKLKMTHSGFGFVEIDPADRVTEQAEDIFIPISKINGAIAPIDTELVNGQIVEIITSSSAKGPSRDWLKMVKTAEARNKIRQWYKKEKRAENIVMGKSEVDKEFRRYGKACPENVKNDILTTVSSRMGSSWSSTSSTAIC